MSENVEYFEILNDDDENKWVKDQPKRHFYKKGVTLRDEVLFGELEKGDKFEVFDGNKQVQHEDGRTEFVAASDPYLWSGIPVIDIE
jgi:hypothetical protein